MPFLVHEPVFKKPLNFDLAAPLGQQSMIYIKLKEIVSRFRKFRLPPRKLMHFGRQPGVTYSLKSTLATKL